MNPGQIYSIGHCKTTLNVLCLYNKKNFSVCRLDSAYRKYFSYGVLSEKYNLTKSYYMQDLSTIKVFNGTMFFTNFFEDSSVLKVQELLLLNKNNKIISSVNFVNWSRWTNELPFISDSNLGKEEIYKNLSYEQKQVFCAIQKIKDISIFL